MNPHSEVHAEAATPDQAPAAQRLKISKKRCSAVLFALSGWAGSRSAAPVALGTGGSSTSPDGGNRPSSLAHESQAQVAVHLNWQRSHSYSSFFSTCTLRTHAHRGLQFDSQGNRTRGTQIHLLSTSKAVFLSDFISLLGTQTTLQRGHRARQSPSAASTSDATASTRITGLRFRYRFMFAFPSDGLCGMAQKSISNREPIMS